MKFPLFAGVAMLAAVGGLALAQPSAAADTEPNGAGGEAVTVRLAPENKSGESGTAKLTSQGDQTKVEISLKGGPKGVSQPAHIHEGTCAKLDPKPKYGLENVVDGKSTTEVPVSLDALLKEKVAINVHKSGNEIKTYVACGNIRTSSAKK